MLFELIFICLKSIDFELFDFIVIITTNLFLTIQFHLFQFIIDENNLKIVNDNFNYNENGDDNSNKSTKSHLTTTVSTTTMTDAVVMEMVEAVIDNNNNNNNNVNSKNDVNLWNIKSENEFVQNDDDNLVPNLVKSTNEQQLTVNNNDNVDINRQGKFSQKNSLNFQC